MKRMLPNNLAWLIPTNAAMIFGSLIERDNDIPDRPAGIHIAVYVTFVLASLAWMRCGLFFDGSQFMIRRVGGSARVPVDYVVVNLQAEATLFSPYGNSGRVSLTDTRSHHRYLVPFFAGSVYAVNNMRKISRRIDQNDL